MQKIVLAFSLLTLIVSLSCKRQKHNPVETAIPSSANVSIKFNHQISGQPITQGEMKYTNSAGNMYSVDLLKYFVSNAVLINENGAEFKLNNYDLMNAFDANFLTVEALNVPNGRYTSMRFLVGVDKPNNHLIGTGDLDPQYNMSWSWATGYIFFKHEGNFKDATNQIKSLTQHLGTDNGLSDVSIPIDLTVSGSNKRMNIMMDLNKVYNSPVIDFNQNDLRMSGGTPSDESWISSMTQNMNDVFVFKNVE
jgi:hypothetical protein